MSQVQGPILDPQVNAVIASLQEARRRPVDGGPRGHSDNDRDPYNYADYGFSIYPEQGDLIYLLCRALGAKRVAEFATSVGMSALYAAAAVRDNGGGEVIGSELVPAKVATARRNLTAAGLADLVDIRQGDAERRCAILADQLIFCWSMAGPAPKGLPWRGR